jgi:hypothetical protein
MIDRLSKNQNWAKGAPWMGIIALVILFWSNRPSSPYFWAFINIPLYLFHQTEEHFRPGGFKQYINRIIFRLPEGEETLTDRKIFWINILLVWVAFLVFGILVLVDLGFGLFIIIFSIINCLTHITQGIKRKQWNPGLVMASIQFIVSIYGAYFLTTHGLEHPLTWWIGAAAVSIAAHAVLFRFVMRKK